MKVLKELDLIASREPLLVGADVKKKILAVLERDCGYLEKRGLMDYSVLIVEVPKHAIGIVNKSYPPPLALVGLDKKQSILGRVTGSVQSLFARIFSRYFPPKIDRSSKIIDNHTAANIYYDGYVDTIMIIVLLTFVLS